MAAAAAIPPVSGMAGWTGAATVPGMLARRISPIVGGTRVTQTPFSVSHLVVAWRGAGQPGIRTRSGSGWGDWRAVRASQHGRHGASGQRSALLTVPDGVGYEIDCCGGAQDVSVTELNTANHPIALRPQPGRPELRIANRTAAVRYVDRGSWGADESSRLVGGDEAWPPQYGSVQTLTVHYTASANDDPNPAATVRAIHYYDAVTQGWGDMGYNFLIDEAGTVYEGRRSGTRSGPGFGPTTTDGRPQVVTGAHVTDYNLGNVGVVLLGDFAGRLPTPAARHALTEVLALLAGVAGLNPLRTTKYADPSLGVARTVGTIAGHRDYAETECPGALFYPQLASLREDVNRRLHS